MKDRVGKIVYNKKLQEGIYKMELKFDDFEKVIGGQFIHILLNSKEHILRRPFCICDFDEKNKSIIICYAVVGDGTKELSKMKAGEEVKAMFPLGNGYIPKENENKIVLLGGGMGSAVLPAIARAFPEKEFISYLGFANKDKVVLEEQMNKLCSYVKVSTDDGSYKESGFITNILKQDLETLNPDAIVVCGPEIMYKVIKKTFADTNIPIYVSLEQRMGCGIGACLVCNCKIQRDGKQEYLRVCKDGPVFNLSEVVL